MDISMKSRNQEMVSAEMRKRLLTNRNGRLTADQWKDIVTEPLVWLLLLMPPAILMLGSRLLTATGIWVLILLFVVVVAIPVFTRAQRYARAPVHFARLYPGKETPPAWMFWKTAVLHRQTGEMLRFEKRLAPHVRLQRDQAYVVYYLEDPASRVLLSIAPADHPDVEQWLPTGEFETRFARRTRR